MGDGSCCCACCSTNINYWVVPAACALNTINKLNKDQTLIEACPDPYDDATTEEEYTALLCAGTLPKYRKQTNPVKSGQCASSAPESIETEQKCYICENCVYACGSGVPVECEPPDYCTDVYQCKVPGVIKYAIQSCLPAVQAQCAWCENNERDNNPAEYDAMCNPNLGICSELPATVCKEGGGPPVAGGDACYHAAFDKETNPFTTDCSQAPVCEFAGTSCGCSPEDPCCIPGILFDKIAIDIGQDLCGNSYQACGSECRNQGYIFCCASRPECENSPCRYPC